MAKKQASSVFVCADCGNEFARWVGQCSVCGGWNTLKEVNISSPKNKPSGKMLGGVSSSRVAASGVSASVNHRQSTGWGEFDRVLGGELENRGLVDGSVILLTGEPGIGKSTILSQLTMNVAKENQSVLYVSGEESVSQVGLRLKRLAVNDDKKRSLDHIELISTDDLDTVLSNMEEKKWGLVIIDSIQTMSDQSISGGSGSVSQIKECASKLIMAAKRLGVPMVLVGHVTKDGSIAGPRLLEHMVDVVLTFDGDKQTSVRILRGVKNRFGATDEVGIFVMDNDGLDEQSNPSELFVASSSTGVAGSVLSVVIEGSRPLVIEIQALVSPTQYPAPRRVVSGYDYNRVMTIIAVLMQRCGLRLDSKDVYVNVVGGMTLDDPGVDFAVAMAIASSVRGRVVPEKIAFVGEVGLTGEVRRVKDMKIRVREFIRLGYKEVWGPDVREINGSGLVEIAYLSEALKKAGLIS